MDDNKETNPVDPNIPGGATEPSKPDSEAKEVSVPVSQLEEIIRQNEAFRKALEERDIQLGDTNEKVDKLMKRVTELSSDVPPFAEEVKENQVRLQMYGDKAILKLVNRSPNPRRIKYIYQEMDPVIPTRINDYVDVVIEGSEDPVKILYRDFYEADSVSVPVVKQERKPIKAEYGVVKKVEHEDWSSKETGDRVKLEVIGEEVVHTVKLPSGAEVEVPENVINVR